MFWVYLLECIDDKSWYIGFTSDLKRRLQEHYSKNGGRTTEMKENWHLIYCEGYLNKNDATGREKFLKSGSGRRFLKNKYKTICETKDGYLVLGYVGIFISVKQKNTPTGENKPVGVSVFPPFKESELCRN